MKLNNQGCAIISALALVVTSATGAPMTPQQAITRMTRGINMGRCLDMPHEGDAQRVQEYYFEDFKNAGFNFVRVPVQWDQHTGTNAPYTVDSAWLSRVQQVADWGLKRGLIVMINSHHDGWILENAGYTANDKARFESIWAQVSYRLRTNSASLLFEIANEPLALSISQINQLNASVISIIRSNNPTRIIVYSGNGYTSVDQMKSAARPNDPNIMATFHSYDPWDFAGNGNGTWGTSADKQAVTNRFAAAATWSQQYHIPVILGEWGTVSWCDAPSRASFIATYSQEASRTGVVPCIWHDFGWFGIYYPNNAQGTRWSNVKVIIMANTLPAPNPPVVITDLDVQTNTFGFAWSSVAGNLYNIEYSHNLLAWSNLVTGIPASAGTATSMVLNRVSSHTGTNDLLLQYAMGQSGPQIQNIIEGVAGGDLTKGGGLNLFDPLSAIAYPTVPSLAVTFNAVTPDLATAIGNNSFFTFTLTVGSNVADLDLNSLAFNAARGGAGVPRGYAVFATTPTTTNEQVQGDTQLTTQRTDWGPLQKVGFSRFKSLQNLTAGQTILFKVPVYSPTTISSLDFDNIAIYGQSKFRNALAEAGAREFFFRIRQQQSQ
jgi:aryl-phospho-beta-D-glucosidase BglC (GH1 family)